LLVTIDDPSDPRLADYRDLKEAGLRARELRGEHSHFIAEGENVVLHLLASKYPIRSLLLSPRFANERMTQHLSGLPSQTPVYVATQAVLEAVIGFEFHRGAIASADRVPEPTINDVLATARALVICEHLSNTDNMGAVFRNAACMIGSGAAVLLAGECCHPLYRKAIRVSMGHALRIPFMTLLNWPESLELIHQAGFTSIAMTPSPDAQDIRTLGPVAKPAILVGAEGPGLSPQTIQAAQRKARIAMAPHCDSLNVATALAVGLHAVVTPL
jgi:tRNA G18 (ribose-2'-O)-methylase SpoU